MRIAPAYCICKNLWLVNLSSNNVFCLFKVLLCRSRISVSCLMLWSVDWLVEHGQGKWVRLSSCLFKSPFLFIFLRKGICRLCFFSFCVIVIFFCPLKIRRLCECGCLDNLTYSDNDVCVCVCVFFFSGSLVVCFVLRMYKLQVSSHWSRLFRQCSFVVIVSSPILNREWYMSAPKKR